MFGRRGSQQSDDMAAAERSEPLDLGEPESAEQDQLADAPRRVSGRRWRPEWRHNHASGEGGELDGDALGEADSGACHCRLAAGGGWAVRTLAGSLVRALPAVVPATRCGMCCLSFVEPLV